MSWKSLWVAAGLGLAAPALAQTGGSGGATPPAPIQNPREYVGVPDKPVGGELQGTLLAVDRRTLYIEGPQGLAIPVEVGRDVRINGQPLQRGRGMEPQLELQLHPGDQVRVRFERQQERDNAPPRNVSSAVDNLSRK